MTSTSKVNVGECINTNRSVKGSDLLAWIAVDRSAKTQDQATISRNLYHKYVVDRDGNPKNKIQNDTYYYVNYNNRKNPSVYLAYIVRDKSRSPRTIPEALASVNMVDSKESYKGSIIQEWAYYHNGSPEREFYMEGNEIITKYFECVHPLRHNVFYFVNKTSKGIKVFRDIAKSPRADEESGVSHEC